MGVVKDTLREMKHAAIKLFIVGFYGVKTVEEFNPEHYILSMNGTAQYYQGTDGYFYSFKAEDRRTPARYDISQIRKKKVFKRGRMKNLVYAPFLKHHWLVNPNSTAHDWKLRKGTPE